MSSTWTGRRLVWISALALLIPAVQPVFAQKGPPGAGGSRSNPGSVPPSSNVPTPNPNNPNNPNVGNPFPNNTPTNPSPSMGHTIFLSGKVLFDDGTPPNSGIRIERVCSGNPHLEAYVDRKGNFSFQLGKNGMVDADAEDASAGGMFGQPGLSDVSPGSQQGMNSAEPLWNCELRAAYPGYRSDVVELGTRRTLDDPNVGTIVLHRLAKVAGTTLSVTTALAPKNAQKDYQKGLQFAKKGDFEQAEKRLTKATDEYPKYATAWFALGEVQQREGRPQDARKSYAASIAADGRYVSPYDQLALLSIQDGKWQDAADYSKRAIELNPVEFPAAFWFNAVANYKLKKSEEAEKSAKELVRMDTAHRYPDAESLLGELLLDRGDYPDAATHLRAYLALRPGAKNADQVKQVLAKIEQASAEAKK